METTQIDAKVQAQAQAFNRLGDALKSAGVALKDLAMAFDAWADEYAKDPAKFAPVGGTGYGDACAQYLVQTLARLQRGRKTSGR